MGDQVNVVHNLENLRFEVRKDDHLAELVYRLKEDTIYLMHTGVPDAMGNQGIAQALTEYALKYSLKKGYKIVAYCPYVRAYMQRNSDWREKLSPDK